MKLKPTVAVTAVLLVALLLAAAMRTPAQGHQTIYQISCPFMVPV